MSNNFYFYTELRRFNSLYTRGNLSANLEEISEIFQNIERFSGDKDIFVKLGIKKTVEVLSEQYRQEKNYKQKREQIKAEFKKAAASLRTELTNKYGRVSPSQMQTLAVSCNLLRDTDIDALRTLYEHNEKFDDKDFSEIITRHKLNVEHIKGNQERNEHHYKQFEEQSKKVLLSIHDNLGVLSSHFTENMTKFQVDAIESLLEMVTDNRGLTTYTQNCAEELFSDLSQAQLHEFCRKLTEKCDTQKLWNNIKNAFAKNSKVISLISQLELEFVIKKFPLSTSSAEESSGARIIITDDKLISELWKVLSDPELSSSIELGADATKIDTSATTTANLEISWGIFDAILRYPDAYVTCSFDQAISKISSISRPTTLILDGHGSTEINKITGEIVGKVSVGMGRESLSAGDLQQQVAALLAADSGGRIEHIKLQACLSGEISHSEEVNCYVKVKPEKETETSSKNKLVIQYTDASTINLKYAGKYMSPAQAVFDAITASAHEHIVFTFSRNLVNPAPILGMGNYGVKPEESSGRFTPWPENTPITNTGKIEDEEKRADDAVKPIINPETTKTTTLIVNSESTEGRKQSNLSDDIRKGSYERVDSPFRTPANSIGESDTAGLPPSPRRPSGSR